MATGDIVTAPAWALSPRSDGAAVASATTSSMSLYPHYLFRPLRLASNVAFPRTCVCRLVERVGEQRALAPRDGGGRRRALRASRATSTISLLFTTSTASTPASAPRVRETSPGALVDARTPARGRTRRPRGALGRAARSRGGAPRRTPSRPGPWAGTRNRGARRRGARSAARCRTPARPPPRRSVRTPSGGANASAIGTLSRSAAEEEAALFNVPKSLRHGVGVGSGFGRSRGARREGARAEDSDVSPRGRSRTEQTRAREAAAETRQSSEAIGRSPRGRHEGAGDGASRPRKLGACAGDPVDAPRHEQRPESSDRSC